MAETLYTINNLLVSRGGLLNTCCCDDFFYWESYPCSLSSIPGETCNDADQCKFHNREYVTHNVNCEGNDRYVCECQKLVLSSFINTQSSNASALSLFAQPGYSNITGVIGTGSLTLSVFKTADQAYQQSYLYSDYNSFDHLTSGITSSSLGGGVPWSVSVDGVDRTAPPDILTVGTFSHPTALVFAQQTPALKFITDNGTSDLVFWSSNVNTFAARIQAKLSFLYQGLIVIPEVNSPGLFQNFHIRFEGDPSDFGSCGRSYDKLIVQNRLSYNFVNTSGATIKDGVYVNSWSNEIADNYSWSPTGDLRCPYEDPNYVSGPDSGYLAYDEDVQCCPQKGLTIGPPQNLLGSNAYGSSFENLENTVILAATGGFPSGCYKINPFFFIFGKEGRFETNPLISLSNYVDPSCNYSISGRCDNVLPTNCEVQLFIPFFNKNIPWGPYGSYYLDIEDDFHPAFDLSLEDPTFDLSNCNIPKNQARRGCFYKPSGHIRTRGSWTETETINVDFIYAKNTPFYMGETCGVCPSGDDYWFGQIDPSTYSATSGFSVSGNAGGPLASNAGIISISFACSGKTILDFINGMNAIKTKATPSGVSCNVFAFCPAATGADLIRIPASKINNASSELYQCWKDLAPTGGSYEISNTQGGGVSSPELDQYMFGGSDIFASPKDYALTFREDEGNYPTIVNSDSLTCTAPCRLPPVCRRSHALPENPNTNVEFDYIRNTTPWWNSMAGETRTLCNIHLNSGILLDPQVAHLYLSVTGRRLQWEMRNSSDTLLYQSGIDTNRNGSGYSLSGFITDINRASHPWTLNPSIIYNPFVATTGSDVPYDIYLDNSTWVSGVGYGAPSDFGVGRRTSINYGYFENLDQLPRFDFFASNDNVDLTAWIRRRCGYKLNPASTTEIEKLSPVYPCASPNAPKIKTPNKINCQDDSVENNNHLVTYGCGGDVCRDDFYIKASRCSCTTMKYCYELEGYREVDHPFNRPVNNSSEDFAQPTVFICSSNIHPDCDIPFLIKVPYQYYIDEPPAINNHPDCSGYQNPPSITVQYSQPPFTNTWQAMNVGYEGWCQYVDPENVDLVPKREIERTYPPKSLIVERSPKVFCTTNVNPFDLPQVSNDFGKYDSIGPLIPAVPYEFIFPPNHVVNCLDPVDVGSLPVPLYDPTSNTVVDLYAYIRPVVKELKTSDICPINGNDSRVDIDCNTRCCGCGFICDPDDPNASDSMGPVRAVEIAVQTNDNLFVTDVPYACINNIDIASPAISVCGNFLCTYCDCNPPPGCQGPNGCSCCYQGLCIADTQDYSLVQTFGASYGLPTLAAVTIDDNGICLRIEFGRECCFNLQGTSTSTFEVIGGGCTGDWATSCDTNAANYCHQSESTACYIQETTNATCEGIQVPPYSEGTVNTSDSIILPDCTFGNAFGFLITRTNNTTTTLNTNLNNCSNGSITWSQTSVTNHVINQSCGNRTFNEISQRNGSKVINAPTFDECGYDSIGNQPSYQYIIGREFGWSCGISSDVEATGCSGQNYTY